MKALFVSALAASAIYLSGCASGPGEGARSPAVVPGADLENKSEYALMGPRVQRSIDISNTQKRFLADGRLELITNIRNRENRRIEVQVSCVFKDERNFATGDETPWQTLILTENAQEAVNFTSMNDRAKNFTIRVRESH